MTFSPNARSLYPFSILFRELSAEQKGKLLERAQRWPEPLAKQLAKAAGTVARFRDRSNGFFFLPRHPELWKRKNSKARGAHFWSTI
jgi:hypothetical protein